MINQGSIVASAPFAIDADAACPSCRRLAFRLHELQSLNDRLRHEAEVGAWRLKTVMDQLALAEERAGHRTLASAIRAVSAGQPNVSFDAAWALLGEHESADRPPAGPAQRLGSREREVLRLITEGRRTPHIAEHLGIAVGTVEVHRRNIMRKLGLHSVAALTKFALREGLASP